METNHFANRFVKHLRKCADNLSKRKSGPAGSREATEQELIIALTISEVADCVENTLIEIYNES